MANQKSVLTHLLLSVIESQPKHDDVIKWKHIRRYWPFMQGIRRSSVNSRTKASDAEFDVFFYLRLNKRSKQSRDWWIETPSCPLKRHCNGTKSMITSVIYAARWKIYHFLISLHYYKSERDGIFSNTTRSHTEFDGLSDKNKFAFLSETSISLYWHG